MNPETKQDRAEPSDSAGAVVLPELDITAAELNRAYGDTDGNQDSHLFVVSRRPVYVGLDDILAELYCRERQLLASLTREKELRASLEYLTEYVSGYSRAVGRAELAETERDALSEELWRYKGNAQAEIDALRAERDAQCKVTPETPDPTWVPSPWEPPAKEEWVPKAERLSTGSGTRADWCLVAYSLSVKMEEASRELMALRAEVATLRGEGPTMCLACPHVEHECECSNETCLCVQYPSLRGRKVKRGYNIRAIISEAQLEQWRKEDNER